MDHSFLLEVKGKINELNEQTENYVNVIRLLIKEHERIEKETSLISYFTYSFNLAHNYEDESIMIGSYHIHNIGNKLLTNPYICIKISSESPFHFSGKYMYSSSQKLLQPTHTWKRLDMETSKDEFWLQPIQTTKIKPGEMLTFSNFQIKWRAEESYAASIMGFTYTDEYKDGTSCINPIYINGS